MSNELIGNFSNGAGLVGNLGNTGSGTDNYNDLVNKPSINGVTLAGNKTLTDLGINIPTKVSQLQNDSHYVQQSAIPTKTSQLQNDSGFAYAANLATVATTGSYNNLTDKPTIPTKTSQLQNDSNFVTSSSLATVATSGSYDDLTDKPTIPAAQVNSDWNSNSGVSQILNKPNLAAVATSGSYDDLTDTPNLAAVATSGSYDDLTDKPTIPAAQVNSDWNSNSGVSQILNKPTIPSNSDFSLAGLSDTTITTPSNGQVLSYSTDKWVNNNLLVSREGIGTLTAVNDTVQIPSDVLAKSIIVIVLRRYGYFGTITVSRSLLLQGAYTAGTQVYGDNNNSWKINISNTGVITLSAISGTAFPNIDCYGLL